MSEKPTGDDEFNCIACTQKDTNEMVRCDVCKGWIHFSCANVTAEIENHPFTCGFCIKKKNDRKYQAAMKAKQMKEKEEAKKKEELEKALKEKAELAKKLAAAAGKPSTSTGIQDKDDIEKAPTIVSTSSKKSENRQRGLKLLEVLEEQRKAAENRDRIYFEEKMKIISEMEMSELSSDSENENDDVNKDANRKFLENWTDQQSKVSFNKNVATRDKTDASAKKNMPTSSRPSLSYLNPSNQHEFINSTTLNSSRIFSRDINFEDSIKRIAAKHVYDLPSFSGCPSDWPMFLSTYMRSSVALNLSNHENMFRLQKSLKGDALNLVKSYLIYEESVPKAINALRMRFGRPDLVLDEMIKKVRAVPKINVEKLDTILDLSMAVQHLCVTMEASGMVNHMNNPALLQELIEKLPGAQRLEWASYRLNSQNVNVALFDQWLCELADKASTVMSSSLLTARNTATTTNADNKGRKKNERKNEHVHAAHSDETSETVSKNEQLCGICSGSNHPAQDCAKFVAKDVSSRWDDVRKYNLCRKCLKKHYWKTCKSKQACGVNGCPFRHHVLLHDIKKHAVDNTSKEENNATGHAISIHTMKPAKTLFRVVPVILFGLNSSVETFAFFDEGSSRTLLDEEVSKQLNLRGPNEPLHLKWTGDIMREESGSRRVSIEISGIGNGKKRYRISNVRTVENLNLGYQSMEYSSIVSKYQHLQNLPVTSFKNARPRILIGIEHWHLGMPLKIKDGADDEPIATKTKLGWTIFGVQKTSNNEEIQNTHYHVCDCSSNDDLNIGMKEFFSVESFGVKTPDKVLQSLEDQRAIQIQEKTTKKLNNRYETGLLWRYDDVRFPDSFNMALRRMSCLESRMRKNPILAANLKNQIKDYISKGYARKLSDKEIHESKAKTWYLPLFTTVNVNKPDKVRLIWDAAASINGISLNSMLLKGPDMLCSLPEILYRFRERRVAIVGDITEMYHQVAIIREDQDSQRFLWRDNPSEKPAAYAMNVMTFGASCSPSSAHYVKNLNARDYLKESPRAVAAICNNHYVDDWLDCFDNEIEAINITKDVIRIHKSAGFTIQKWVSNSNQVLQSLGVNTKENDTIDLNMNNEAISAKVLGMWWEPRKDEFFFKFDPSRINEEILSGIRRPTKREVLRTMMMIYDPLGLISPLLVYVKILLQDIWRSKIDWDQVVDNNQFEKWMKWTNVLVKIQDIKIPRCHFGEKFKSLELHVFVDASDSAYAAAAYFRFSSDDGNVRCSLVAGKTKVAPLNPLSIPRLELQAAVLGARLSNSITTGHTLKPDRVTFWTDSVDVLCWVKSDLRKYRQFVAFRVSEILETTDIANWRWIPSKYNPADDATKWKYQAKLSSESRWYTGPTFLMQPESEWPIEVHRNSKKKENDEIKPQLSHVTNDSDEIDLMVDRCSNWRKAYRVTAWVLRFVDNLKSKSRNTCRVLGSQEIKRAKSALYRQAQKVYSEEICMLEKWPGKSVPKSSVLHKMSPFLDDLRVLRMKGRTRRCEIISFDVINPVLLPKNHRITQLIVSYYHTKYLHANHETVVNQIRQLYVIPHLRVVLNHISTTCQMCKNRRAVPKPPEMAELPMARLAAFVKPFSYVGIDYFGPLEVVVGRHVEKRWGCLFTCLTIRAIHIEISYSLSKDSFMMCLRKFIARRGMPIEIRTDNGTNFIGVRNELAKITNNIPLDEVKAEFDEINWVLNPPAAPHMGGSWERLVKSIKKCLESKMPTHKPDDEHLYCYLLEVECIINSRPLTYLPIRPDEVEALTPNHFLVGSSGGAKPFCEFDDNILTTRRSYGLSQQMALHFWRRWLREYLPELTRRTKWHEKVDPIKKGDIVIIMDESKRNSWSKGIVTETIAGRNADQIRQVRVRTANGSYVRPASKVAVLDIEQDSKLNIDPSSPFCLTRGENVGGANIKNPA